MKSDIFHRDEGEMIPENKSFFNDNLADVIEKDFHLLENEDHYRAEIEASGIDMEDFKINVKERVLYIVGFHKDPETKELRPCDEESDYYHTFQQSLLLPEDADENKISTQMEGDTFIIKIDKKSSPTKTADPVSEQSTEENKPVFHSRTGEETGKPRSGGRGGFFSRLFRKLFG